jgi:hypothetical protein
MSHNPLIIGPKEIDALKEAMSRARLKPMSLEMVTRGYNPHEVKAELTLADREKLAKRGAPPPLPSSEMVTLPNDYRVGISFEEQPAGLCMHLSMSSRRKRKVPTPEAMEMVLAALGYPYSMEDCAMVWLEEFEPGQNAVNAVLVIEPRSRQ